eukprot:GILI01001836.1.p2 GENE.GILI01001836.1~~GILI01001836.1.p2  ORF type:complete len:1015 (+),score=381.10 GILI01001836.1:155-3199(+)
MLRLTTSIAARAVPKSVARATPLALARPTAASSRIFSTSTSDKRKLLAPSDTFISRHIGPSEAETKAMLQKVGANSVQELIEQTIPKQIRLNRGLKFSSFREGRGESEMLQELKEIASKNKIFKSFIGAGYYGTILPPVILRNLLENPAWYTSYTPYQAEISQGRLESLLNFQTLVTDLTGLPIANASLLDEATACAEAMYMCNAFSSNKSFFVSSDCHPQNIALVQTRARAIGVNVIVGDHATFDFAANPVSGALVQYPTTDGRVLDYSGFVNKAHEGGAKVVVSTDLLALTSIKAPGEFGADIVCGSAQRFGVPMGFGGPHAAFFATKDEFKRKMPGRVIGVSRDSRGKPALRMSMQTREQHIRREKATSNICTAQALLANIAAMYAIYHGPQGLRRIADRVHTYAGVLAEGVKALGYEVPTETFFDTITVKGVSADKLLKIGYDSQINLRRLDSNSVSVSVDETTDLKDLNTLLSVFSQGITGNATHSLDLDALLARVGSEYPETLRRSTPFLTHPIFNSISSETQMLRYLYRLQQKDLSLATSMIPLGSCTMKLNATSEMIPITWPEFGNLHPFVPADQAKGYHIMMNQLREALCEVTGFAEVSLQPNSGAQGEYAGLLAIKKYHESRGDLQRDVCLIPTSAHGTNPASAILAGMQVVVVQCDEHGNIDVGDLSAKIAQHKDRLSALMVTYPSTHGVFEESIKDVCAMVHEAGGQVYMDGANMNAQVGLTRPGDIGADVCHLNLHKTFCIPHGGGGPGMGPIGVVKHLAPFLPNHPVVDMTDGNKIRDSSDSSQSYGTVSAAPYGSASILPISYMYIALMGAEGLRRSTQFAILNANYMAARLRDHYPILFTGRNGRVAHEFIIDIRPLKAATGITEEDVAKRLMDFGFHAPTMSFPVAGTLMIEPTESEDKGELDRLCDALIIIRQEIRDVEEGRADPKDNALKGAPHTMDVVCNSNWTRKYSREQAAFPAPWVHSLGKFWPSVGRIDNVWGDRNLVCTCPPVSDYETK